MVTVKINVLTLPGPIVAGAKAFEKPVFDGSVFRLTKVQTTVSPAVRSMKAVGPSKSLSPLQDEKESPKTHPVGTVCFAVTVDGRTETVERRFGDLGRELLRQRSVREALLRLYRALP